MRKYLFFASLLAAVSTYSQSDKYVDAMEKNLAKFGGRQTTEGYQSLSAAFQRIGDAEKTQWLPYYYAGLALTTAAWTDMNLDKDANAQKVKELLDKADALIKDSADRAEVLAVRYMAATQQMLVDPPNRYMNYGMEAAQYLKHARDISPDNPRLVYLEGAGLFGTPEQFGGGKAKAKPVLEKAVALYKAAKPQPLYPGWGQEQAEVMLKQCDE